MKTILKCIQSGNTNFHEGGRYLLIDGILTCDCNGYGTNIYTTNKVQKELREKLLMSVQDVNDYFSNRGYTLRFIEDEITSDNWFM